MELQTVEILDIAGYLSNETFSKVCYELARNEDCRVRYLVAEHVKAPVRVLTKLAEDKSVAVCYAVAENPNTSQEIHIQLTVRKLFGKKENKN